MADVILTPAADSGRAHVDFEYNTVIIGLIKAIPPYARHWDQRYKQWTVNVAHIPKLVAALRSWGFTIENNVVRTPSKNIPAYEVPRPKQKPRKLKGYRKCNIATKPKVSSNS